MKRLVLVVIAAISLGLAAPALAVLPTTINSPYFAGYFRPDPVVNKLNVAATMTVPKLHCSGATEEAIDPSVGISNNSATLSSAGLFAGCYNGRPRYFLSLQLSDPTVQTFNYMRLRPSAGDKVKLRVSQDLSSTYVSAADQTHRSVHKSLQAAGHPPYASPWVGDSPWEISGKALSPPNFGRLHFSGAKLNGVPFGGVFGTAGAEPLWRYNRVSGATVVIQSSLFSTNSESFQTTFK
jgi:hypothetical protein